MNLLKYSTERLQAVTNKVRDRARLLWDLKIKRIHKLERIDLEDIRSRHVDKLSHPMGLTPMNMVRNKKSGVVVVVPGKAHQVRELYGEKAKDFELVESRIKE
jgi:hypothetical protein